LPNSHGEGYFEIIDPQSHSFGSPHCISFCGILLGGADALGFAGFFRHTNEKTKFEFAGLK
jgi:hypothetical protein